jgi:hypothetical protein
VIFLPSAGSSADLTCGIRFDLANQRDEVLRRRLVLTIYPQTLPVQLLLLYYKTYARCDCFFLAGNRD